jgi:hypothetical protein
MKILNLTILALACGANWPASAQARDKHAVEGTWVLQSIYEEDDAGEELDRWGERPTGQFIADIWGHFSFQLVGRGAIRFASASSAPVSSMITDRETLAYTGTYVMDAEHSTITLAIEDATVAGWDRKHPKASITVGQDTLDFVSSIGSPTGMFYTHLVWKRAS